MSMDNSTSGLDDSKVVKLTGKIMMFAILVLFSVVVLVLCLHLYAKWYWRHNVVDSPNNRRRRRRFFFAPGQPNTGDSQLRRGLDPLVLNSLPLIVFNPQEFKNKEEGLECAVCLSDVVEGEKIRMLPKCEHGFHVECIDMWFASHSTCPLCRHAVEEGSLEQRECSVEIPENSGSEFSLDSPNFPTNVLFWGDQNTVSSGGPGLEEGPSSSNKGLCASCSSDNRNASRRVEWRLVIDIPSERAMASSLGSPSVSGSARFVEEDLKSPMATRLRSLKRMLSRDSRRISPCSTSSGVDLEAGGTAQTPQS